MAYGVEQDEMAEGYAYNQGGYETEAGTVMLAKHCIFCGRALRTPSSVEQGCGDICADKWGVFEAEQGAFNEGALAKALETAPDELKEAMAQREGDPAGQVSMIVHVAGNAWERGAGNWANVLGSAMEITSALGYPGTARGIQARIIEGRDFDEQGQETRAKRKPKGIVVKQMDDGRWHLHLPYIEGVGWRLVMQALRGAGAQEERGYTHTFKPDQWLRIVNALVDQLGGTLGILPTGEPFVVPMQKVPVPEDAPAPEGGPTKIEPQKPEEPIHDVQKGQEVTLNDGRKAIVAWVGIQRGGGKGVGLIPVEDAKRMMKERGYISMSLAQEGRKLWCGVGDVTPVEAKPDEIKAVEEQVGRPLPERVKKTELPPHLKPWQREGVLWLEEKGSGVLAMEQGTGKTATAIAAMDVPALVLCPASMRITWSREVRRWAPGLTCAVVEREKDLDEPALKADVLIMGYDRLGEGTRAALRGRGVATLVVDESDVCKEFELYWRKVGERWEAKTAGPIRAQAIYDLFLDARRRFFLTGTPMINGRPKELWPLLYMSDPREWRSMKDYRDQYCDPQPVHIPGGRIITNYDGHSNLQELRERVMGHFMFRVTKEVLGLPPKMREQKLIALSPDAKEQYIRAAQEFIAWVREMRGPEAAFKAGRAKAIAMLTALRRLCAIGKAPTVAEEAIKFLRDTGRPLIVAGHHVEGLTTIVEAIRAAGYTCETITGASTPKQRVKAADGFQIGVPERAPPEKRKYVDCLVCSIQAAGKGLTLTRAEDMLIFERVWRPFDLIQMEDRIHRMGTKNKVTITYYDAPGTIDEKLAKLLSDKMVIAAMVLDGHDLDEEEAAHEVFKDMFKELAEQMMRNPGGDVDEDAELDWVYPE